jgi:hypothetical protein
MKYFEKKGNNAKFSHIDPYKTEMMLQEEEEEEEEENNCLLH